MPRARASISSTRSITPNWSAGLDKTPVFLPILLGTNRKLRRSVHVAHWLHGAMSARPDIETQLFDVADFALPQDDYGTDIKAPVS